MLENTQLVLIATVHKLYTMVRNSQRWELGEPELNDRGLPVIHSIASKLGCIYTSSNANMPLHFIDHIGLAAELEKQERIRNNQACAEGGSI